MWIMTDFEVSINNITQEGNEPRLMGGQFERSSFKIIVNDVATANAVWQMPYLCLCRLSHTGHF